MNRYLRLAKAQDVRKATQCIITGVYLMFNIFQQLMCKHTVTHSEEYHHWDRWTERVQGGGLTQFSAYKFSIQYTKCLGCGKKDNKQFKSYPPIGGTNVYN